MRTLTLLLQNSRSEELGRMNVDGVFVASSQASGEHTERGTPVQQMEALYKQIEATLNTEGITYDGDSLEFQYAVCKALLTDQTVEGVVIPLIIHDRSDVTPDNPPSTEPNGSEWDDLFEVEEPHGDPEPLS